MRTRVVHCKKERYDVYIGRPGYYGNPFKVGPDGSREEVIQKYREWIATQPDLIARAKRELAGKVLGCWCAPQLCHGHVLAMIVDQPSLFEEPDPHAEWLKLPCRSCGAGAGEHCWTAERQYREPHMPRLEDVRRWNKWHSLAS